MMTIQVHKHVLKGPNDLSFYPEYINLNVMHAPHQSYNPASVTIATATCIAI